jgi:hypothetical protein
LYNPYQWGEMQVSGVRFVTGSNLNALSPPPVH